METVSYVSTSIAMIYTELSLEYSMCPQQQFSSSLFLHLSEFNAREKSNPTTSICIRASLGSTTVKDSVQQTL